METSLGSELLLLSGTLPPPLSPLDLELEKDEMDAEGDLDDDEGEDVDAVADPTPAGQPSSARGGSADGTSAMAASLGRWGDEGQFTTEGQGTHNYTKGLLNFILFAYLR